MSTHADWIAYVGPFRFPWGEAGSRRVFGIAQSLNSRGYNVVVGSGEAGPADLTWVAGTDGPGSMSYLGLGELPASSQSLAAKSLQRFIRAGQRTVAWLRAQPTRPSHVLVYGGGAPYAAHLQRWCHANDIPLVADIVEWYSHQQLPGGFFGPPHLSAKIALRRYYPRCDGIIAISSMLERHYQARGCRVVRVPPTLDVAGLSIAPAAPRPDRPGLTLIYSGTPGKKDLLSNIVHGVAKVRAEGGPVSLQVIGPTVDQVRDLVGPALDPIGVRVLGPVPQPDVPHLLRQADFTVLLRRPARFAEAGFPTKFCESIANATPVIANLTSDLGTHLRDGIEGLVCADHSIDALAHTLRRALRLNHDERSRMRWAARAEAERSFDYRRHADSLHGFLQSLPRPAGHQRALHGADSSNSSGGLSW